MISDRRRQRELLLDLGLEIARTVGVLNDVDRAAEVTDGRVIESGSEVERRLRAAGRQRGDRIAVLADGERRAIWYAAE